MLGIVKQSGKQCQKVLKYQNHPLADIIDQTPNVFESVLEHREFILRTITTLNETYHCMMFEMCRDFEYHLPDYD